METLVIATVELILLVLAILFFYGHYAAKAVRLQAKLIGLLEARQVTNISVTLPKRLLGVDTDFRVRLIDRYDNLLSGRVRRDAQLLDVDIDALLDSVPAYFNVATPLSSKEQIISDLSAENAQLRTEIAQLRNT